MDDDCEDQGLCPTKVCIKFECQWWEGDVRHQPALELRGKYWCCPKCHSSYGEHAHPDLVAKAKNNAVVLPVIRVERY